MAGQLGVLSGFVAPPDAVIRTHGLTKHYGEVQAVVDLDLDVRRGEIYAFLGRNGAGKTTTIRMLLGLVRPTSGEATLLGTRIAPGESRVFARVGYLVETATAYPNLTVRENLDVQRRLTAAPDTAVGAALELLGLAGSAQRRAGQLSLGNKQRLALARALLHRPDLLILDEPANGLDPAGIIEVRELLRRLTDDHGVTVFMSSHMLAEVAHLADRIGIVHAGRLVQEIDYDALRARTRQYLEIGVSEPDRAAGLLAQHFGIDAIERTPEGLLRLFGGLDRGADIVRALVGAGLDVTRLVQAQEDLESYFMRLTGGER
jgi:ABC-2 type transport system ATP-binding protein